MRLEIIQNNYLHVPGFINSHAMYNFLPFVKLLVKKISHVNELLGEEVLPTYTYARVYKNGSVLERHRDRPACEISFTINLEKDTDWPLYFQRPDNSEAQAELTPGDAVLYLGCQADHWRNKFEGKEHTQLFMHYVRSNGTKSWAFFDKQQQQSPTTAVTDLPVTIL